MRAVSIEQMRELERRAMAEGICGYELMRRAGEGAAAGLLRFVRDRYPEQHRRRFAVFAGKGNNGGDAWVVCRRLFQLGCQVTLYSVCPPEALTGDAHDHASELPPEVPRFVCWDGEIPESAFSAGTVIVDGLLGTGFHGDVRKDMEGILQAINRSGLPVVSLDVPSGISGDTGIGPQAVVADCTFTMGMPKQGLFVEDGLRCSGVIRVIDLDLPDVPEDFWTARNEFTFGTREAAALLQRRAADSHKNIFGHALCLAGSKQYFGAPYLAAEASMLAGAGLVTLGVPAACMDRPSSLSLMIHRLGNGGEPVFTEKMLPELSELLKNKDAVLYGPGISREADPEVLEFLLRKQEIPLVLDADALRIFARCPHLHSLRKESGNLVLTPHPGELRALGEGFGLWILQEQENPLPQIADAVCSICGGTVVFKGRFTRVYDVQGRCSVNLSGNAALATAGTGDVLAGLIAGFLAQGMASADAARLAVFLHGHAADIWTGPQRSFTADRLLEIFPAAMQDIAPLA